jgi:S1-C subfamily serine protease
MPLLIALCLSLTSALDTLPPALDAAVARGVRQVEEGDLQGGLETLDGAVRRLSATPPAGDDLALAHLFMGVAYAGLDQDKAAHASFREALRRRRDLALDPQRFPRRTLRLFEEAQGELPPDTPAARAARSVVRLSAADGKPLASAVAVDAAGHALTILSRLAAADAVVATLPDGRRTSARVVGRDALLNVALLALEAAPPALELGDSDPMKEGARLAAVLTGQPAAVEGLVKARDRAGTFLLTDLRLDQTASGSPMLDGEGRLIGIALVDERPVESDPFTKFFGDAGAARLGVAAYRTFAVPASALRTALPQLVELGRVRRGWLGLSLRPVTEQEGKKRLLGALGAIVTEIAAGGPAATAGFLPGDQIVAIAGRAAFEGPDDAFRAFASLAPGTVVDVMVTRSKGRRIHWVKATIGERPPDP